MEKNFILCKIQKLLKYNNEYDLKTPSEKLADANLKLNFSFIFTKKFFKYKSIFMFEYFL